MQKTVFAEVKSEVDRRTFDTEFISVRIGTCTTHSTTQPLNHSTTQPLNHRTLRNTFLFQLQFEVIADVEGFGFCIR